MQIGLEANNSNITTHLLMRLLSSKCLNGDNIHDSTLQLVDVLGGIDQILENYLQSMEIVLSKDKLQQIYQILSTPDKYKAKNKNIPSSTLITDLQTDSHTELQHMHVVTLDDNDTYSYSLFPKHAEFIINALYSNTVKLLIFCSCIVWVMLFLGDFVIRRAAAQWRSRVLCILIYIFIWIPWLILFVLSMNRTGFAMIWRKSFIFWFKMFNSVIFVTVLCIYEYAQNVSTFRLIHNVLYGICLVTTILLISALDTFHVGSKQFRLLMCGGAATTMCCFYIYFQWFAPVQNDMFIYRNYGPYGTLTFHSVLADTSRILAIFLWEQTFHAILMPRKCVLIRYTPYLIWKDTDTKHVHHTPSVNTAEMQKETKNVVSLEMSNSQVPNDKSHADSEECKDNVNESKKEDSEKQLQELFDLALEYHDNNYSDKRNSEISSCRQVICRS